MRKLWRVVIECESEDDMTEMLDVIGKALEKKEDRFSKHVGMELEEVTVCEPEDLVDEIEKQ